MTTDAHTNAAAYGPSQPPDVIGGGKPTGNAAQPENTAPPPTISDAIPDEIAAVVAVRRRQRPWCTGMRILLSVITLAAAIVVVVAIIYVLSREDAEDVVAIELIFRNTSEGGVSAADGDDILPDCNPLILSLPGTADEFAACAIAALAALASADATPSRVAIDYTDPPEVFVEATAYPGGNDSATHVRVQQYVRLYDEVLPVDGGHAVFVTRVDGERHGVVGVASALINVHNGREWEKKHPPACARPWRECVERYRQAVADVDNATTLVVRDAYYSTVVNGGRGGRVAEVHLAVKETRADDAGGGMSVVDAGGVLSASDIVVVDLDAVVEVGVCGALTLIPSTARIDGDPSPPARLPEMAQTLRDVTPDIRPLMTAFDDVAPAMNCTAVLASGRAATGHDGPGGFEVCRAQEEDEDEDEDEETKAAEVFNAITAPGSCAYRLTLPADVCTPEVYTAPQYPPSGPGQTAQVLPTDGDGLYTTTPSAETDNGHAADGSDLNDDARAADLLRTYAVMRVFAAYTESPQAALHDWQASWRPGGLRLTLQPGDTVAAVCGANALACTWAACGAWCAGADCVCPQDEDAYAMVLPDDVDLETFAEAHAAVTAARYGYGGGGNATCRALTALSAGDVSEPAAALRATDIATMWAEHAPLRFALWARTYVRASGPDGNGTATGRPVTHGVRLAAFHNIAFTSFRYYPVQGVVHGAYGVLRGCGGSIGPGAVGSTIASMVYWALAWNRCPMEYRACRREGDPVLTTSRYRSDPVFLVNAAFTYALQVSLPGHTIERFFSAVQSRYRQFYRYDRVISKYELARAGAVLNAMCVGWGHACHGSTALVPADTRRASFELGDQQHFTAARQWSIDGDAMRTTLPQDGASRGGGKEDAIILAAGGVGGDGNATVTPGTMRLVLEAPRSGAYVAEIRWMSVPRAHGEPGDITLSYTAGDGTTPWHLRTLTPPHGPRMFAWSMLTTDTAFLRLAEGHNTVAIRAGGAGVAIAAVNFMRW